MKSILALLLFGMAVAVNAYNARVLWDSLGLLLGLVLFPVMLFVVPVALLLDGVWPLYWLLVPVAAVLFLLDPDADRDESR